MAELVRAARRSIARGSKSFALASHLFDPETRARAWLLYAWCRHCDDVVDAQDHGFATGEDMADIAQRVERLERETRAALAGRPSDCVPFQALARVAADVRMPERYPLELIEGFAMDARDRIYHHESELLDYCHHVAGCVGAMMAIVMGVDPQDRATLTRAADLGLSFQLNNIARDIVDDAAIGRCYLPADWLAAEGIEPGMHAHPVHRRDLARVARRLVDLAERYEESARHGTPMLNDRAAAAVLAAAGIYGDIGRHVRSLGGDAWYHRVRTSTFDKLRWLWRARGEARERHQRWPADTPRPDLWTKIGVDGGV